MSGQELATAMQYGRAIVVNKESYGSIRSHQKQRFPGRPFATELKNPDFVAYPRSFGAHAERVSTTLEFPMALEQACEAGVPDAGRGARRGVTSARHRRRQ